jgi:hypothetical protein
MLLLAGMADVLRLVKVDDLLGDIGGVIGDALDPPATWPGETRSRGFRRGLDGHVSIEVMAPWFWVTGGRKECADAKEIIDVAPTDEGSRGKSRAHPAPPPPPVCKAHLMPERVADMVTSIRTWRPLGPGGISNRASQAPSGNSGRLPGELELGLRCSA